MGQSRNTTLYQNAVNLIIIKLQPLYESESISLADADNEQAEVIRKSQSASYQDLRFVSKLMSN